MNYSEKMALLEMKKEKLQKRLAQISAREKTLAAKKRAANRTNENRRKYALGGVVILAMEEIGIDVFDEAEIVGALLKAYEKYDLETHYNYEAAGEKILFSHRHTDQQSASSQGFSKSEILVEAAPAADDDGGLMAMLTE